MFTFFMDFNKTYLIPKNGVAVDSKDGVPDNIIINHLIRFVTKILMSLQDSLILLFPSVFFQINKQHSDIRGSHTGNAGCLSD